MFLRLRRTVALGDLVAAAYDGAARFSSDSAEVSWLAAQAVTCLLSRQRHPRPRSLLDRFGCDIGTRPGPL